MDPKEYKYGLQDPGQGPFAVTQCLSTATTMTLPCVCALALVCLASLLTPPNGTLGEELQPQEYLEPRTANWFTNLGQINKYMEKLFTGSKRSKNKKPDNTTKSPSGTTYKPSLNITSPPPQTTRNRQSLEPLKPQPGSRSL